MRVTETPNWLGSRPQPAGPRAERGPTRIWALGGGKGGIGKSFIAANAATIAARSGRRVLLVDADLGGANLHTFLGVRSGRRVNLSDYVLERTADLESLALETPIPNLRLLAGALGHTGTAELSADQRALLLEQVRTVSADIVVLDLAAGMDRVPTELFTSADEAILVTTPEPTAIENAYAFLRAGFFRLLAKGLRDSPIRDYLKAAMTERDERGIRAPMDVLLEMERLDPSEAARCRKLLDDFRPRLVINQVRTGEEVRLGFSIRSVCRKYFGVDVDYLGYVNYDDFVWRSIKERRPLVLSYPQSDGALYIRQIVKKLIKS